MRNPERIPIILRELERIWMRHPDWRLGQLVYNIVGRDPFHIEDVDLITRGFEIFNPTDAPNLTDLPQYWIEPNAFKELIQSLSEKAKKEAE